MKEKIEIEYERKSGSFYATLKINGNTSTVSISDIDGACSFDGCSGEMGGVAFLLSIAKSLSPAEKLADLLQRAITNVETDRNRYRSEPSMALLKMQLGKLNEYRKHLKHMARENRGTYSGMGLEGELRLVHRKMTRLRTIITLRMRKQAMGE